MLRYQLEAPHQSTPNENPESFCGEIRKILTIFWYIFQLKSINFAAVSAASLKEFDFTEILPMDNHSQMPCILSLDFHQGNS